MRYLILFCLSLILTTESTRLHAQDTLFTDNFNTCALSPGWQVSSTGNPNPTWYVGLIQNDISPGQSIDSTCFLFIDDYTNGPNMPGYALSFMTPVFDVTPYSTVEFSMDVYFRFGETDYLEILATDGITETLLSRFDNYRTNGADLSEHFTIRQDLALVSTSANTRIIIRYTSPAGSEGHYAGIDNISVVGSGSGVNVVREAFNYCTKPAGWTSDIVSGLGAWKFDRIPLGSSAFYNGNSMDGSCFVFFDDNAEGENAPASTIRLTSPWFSGIDYYKYELNFDAILRFSGKESMTVTLENNQGEKFMLLQSGGHVGGPFFPAYKHYTFDLSPYRTQQLRLIFEYSDGNSWGYWAGIDNVKVTGFGQAYDFCIQSQTLQTDGACKPAYNSTALFDGPPTTCGGRTVGTVWYKWQADFTGIARFSTQANFNDVVSIFSGTCANLQPELCDNRDEHGFTGENTYFPVQTGKQYFLRASGLDEGFGTPRGSLCASISQAPGYPTPPANDDCANAVPLTANAPCVAGDNSHALTSATVPSLNELARADVWYKFTAADLGPNEQYLILSNASFSDIITVYQGGCAALQEVAGNHNGGGLDLPTLVSGQTYYVQIAGNFATVEGSLCAQLAVEDHSPPQNDNCVAAIEVPVDGKCTPGSNRNASFSGYIPNCAVALDRDIWFAFTAPTSGAVHINTGANFEHILAIWSGDCTDLQLVQCVPNPLRCNGYINVTGLSPGQQYLAQIASLDGGSGIGTGDVCLNIIDGQATINFFPLELQVKLPCVGMDSAKIVVTSHGGIPPLVYPANTNGQIVQSGQMYLVVVADSMGCQVHSTGIVAPCSSNICTMTASLTAKHPKCPGDTDGMITAGANGGTGPYLFNWSNGTPTASNTGLGAGTYTLTIYDANGCDLVLTQVLTDPEPIAIALDSVQHPGQGQSNGFIGVSVSGGAGSYQFNWTQNGNPFASGTPNLSNIPAGEYALIVTDSAGCTGSYAYTLTEAVGTKTPRDPFFAKIIPNPARDKAVLAVAFPQPQTLRLTLADAHGRILRSWTASQVSTQHIGINLEGLPAGVYHLKIQAGQEMLTRRIVVAGR